MEDAEKLATYFEETVATWASPEKAYEYRSLYLWDWSFALFPDIEKDARNEIVDKAIELVGDNNDGSCSVND